MNKTITANIAGFIFNIEENAYQILNDYLSAIQRNFLNESERIEIMQDIEARIAELFQECLNAAKEVINNEDIKNVIQVMGTPEDYATAENEEPVYPQAETSKRLFRDPDNVQIYGVSSGIAAYLDWDPVVIRIIFVLLTLLGGSGILIYFVLCVALPEAKTASDKLRMRGEPVNLENIKTHFEETKGEVNTPRNKTKTAIRKGVEKSAKTSKNIGRVLAKIIGIGLICIGIGLTIILFTLLFGSTGLLPVFGSNDVLSLGEFSSLFFPNSLIATLAIIGLLLLLLVPLVGAIYTGIKLVFKVKPSIPHFGLVSATLLMVGMVLCFIAGTQTAMQYQDKGKVTFAYNLPTPTTDTLYVDVMDDVHFNNNLSYYNGDPFELIQVKDENIHFGYPDLRIVENHAETNIQVEISKYARGYSQTDALNRAENFTYEVQSMGNKINFAPYFSAPKKDQWRMQDIQIKIKVPKGKTVHFSENINRILCNAKCEEEVYLSEMNNKFWTMAEIGLVCSGCQSEKTYVSQEVDTILE